MLMTFITYNRRETGSTECNCFVPFSSCLYFAFQLLVTLLLILRIGLNKGSNDITAKRVERKGVESLAGLLLRRKQNTARVSPTRVNMSDTAYLMLCVACVNGQLLIIFGPDSPEFIWSSCAKGL